MCKQILLIERCTDSFCTVSWNLWNKDSTSGYPVCYNVPWPGTSPGRLFLKPESFSFFMHHFGNSETSRKHWLGAVSTHLTFTFNYWNSDFYKLNFILQIMNLLRHVSLFKSLRSLTWISLWYIVCIFTFILIMVKLS